MKEFEVIHTLRVVTRFLAESQEEAEQTGDTKGSEIVDVLLSHESIVSAQIDETEVIELLE